VENRAGQVRPCGIARLACLNRQVYCKKMGATVRWSAVCLVLIGSLWALPASWLASAEGQAKPPSKAAPPAAATCVDVRGEARYAGLGYDHLVHLTSRCTQRVACNVKSNVNPEAQGVELAPSESTTVVTWRGSPAREFVPIASCQPL
jgi:hypothetical protein